MEVDGETATAEDDKDERERNKVKIFLGLMEDEDGNRVEQQEVVVERFEARRLGRLR